MASCPKCGEKLKLTDIKPNCPHCNTNLLYYKIEERLEVDALNAEREHAHTQKKLDRAKAAMAGGPFAIARDVLLVLTICAFLLPLAKLSAAGPFFEASRTFTAIELVTELMEFDFGALGLMGSKIVGTATVFFALSIVTIALALVCALLQLIFSFLSCSPKGFIRNTIFAVLGVVFSVGSIVTFSLFIKSMEKVLPGFMNGSVGFGIYVVIAMFLLVLALNIFIKVKDAVKVEYKPCYIGKDNMLFEDFAAIYGDKEITLDMVVENADKFMKTKEEKAAEALAEAANVGQ
ncbi:MAG: zinc ribbon domain-containing protein [Clostridia bacterium]|nr:zinc ribbon domain-containing protein [Clostridia bacterium]